MYTSDVFALINLLAIASNLFQVVVYASSIYFRFKKPDLERPFKVKNSKVYYVMALLVTKMIHELMFNFTLIQIPVILPVFKLVVSLLFFVIPVYVQPLNAAVSVILILPGLPIYYLLVARGKLPAWIRNFDGTQNY